MSWHRVSESVLMQSRSQLRDAIAAKAAAALVNRPMGIFPDCETVPASGYMQPAAGRIRWGTIGMEEQQMMNEVADHSILFLLIGDVEANVPADKDGRRVITHIRHDPWGEADRKSLIIGVNEPRDMPLPEFWSEADLATLAGLQVRW